MPEEGYEIRKHPDGGRTFTLADPDLTYIRINYQTGLQFGSVGLVIECPFTLKAGEEVIELDPNDPAGLGPLLAIYPDTALDLSMSPDGTLTVEFESGRTLTVRPNRRYEAWNIGEFWCPPGGF